MGALGLLVSAALAALPSRKNRLDRPAHARLQWRKWSDHFSQRVRPEGPSGRPRPARAGLAGADLADRRAGGGGGGREAMVVSRGRRRGGRSSRRKPERVRRR